MKQKGVITQTPKKIKLDNHLLSFWNNTKNKNRMINNAIEKFKDELEKLKKLEK